MGCREEGWEHAGSPVGSHTCYCFEVGVKVKCNCDGSTETASVLWDQDSGIARALLFAAYSPQLKSWMSDGERQGQDLWLTERQIRSASLSGHPGGSGRQGGRGGPGRPLSLSGSWSPPPQADPLQWEATAHRSCPGIKQAQQIGQGVRLTMKYDGLTARLVVWPAFRHFI